jgi:hypothetical protein
MCINISNKVFHMIVSFEPGHYFRPLTNRYFMPLESKFTVNRDDLHDAIMFFKRMLKSKFKSLACKIRVMPGKIEISAGDIVRNVSCSSTEGYYVTMIPLQIIYSYTYTIPPKLLHIATREGEFQCGNSVLRHNSIQMNQWN